MKILVIDGAGFIGSAVMRHIIQHTQDSIVNVDKLIYASTHESLLEAAQFVETLEKRQGYKIACLEDTAFNQGWLSKGELKVLAKPLQKNSYGQCLVDLIESVS